MRNVTAMYFSPTETTEYITEAIAFKLSLAAETVDLTRPAAREKAYEFDGNDIIVLGFPVYGGRVPDVIMPALNNIHAKGSLAVIAGVYGNRAYEDALVEAQDILENHGFQVIAAGAFIGEHSYTSKVATDRPDDDDLRIAVDFASAINLKLESGDLSTPEIPGNRPYKDGMPDMPFKPVVSDACSSCGDCALVCPMGIIDPKSPTETADGCILCCACVKTCPNEARSFTAERLMQIKAMLEEKCLDRKEPELFV